MTLTKEDRSTKTLEYIFVFVSMCVGITAIHLDMKGQNLASVPQEAGCVL